jgi:hypothetical protein
MAQLYSLCVSPKKVWKELPKGTHNDSVSEPGYFKEIYNFIEGLEKEKKSNFTGAGNTLG